MSSPCIGRFESNNRFDRTSPSWAYHIGQACRHGVREADSRLAVVSRCPSDGGVMAELGMAIGWKKPEVLLLGDFPRWAESVGYPLNPTVFTGLPPTGWDSRWYTFVDEPPDPDTAIARWLAGA
ncbi:MAG: nucleoside 2-deoxyribosyltransferase [Gammaproteobacteria bacterium]|nr:nucleoside 2-deoxyribosyltransferase [Gammaproteobacteria bacterium]MDE0247293.1 nucleoside 2-deoxyribosyltransferase [Gammaproteobacteria bacterium]